MKISFKKTAVRVFKIMPALPLAAVALLAPSCITIGNPRVYELQYETRKLNYEKTPDGWTAQDDKLRLTFKSMPVEIVTGSPVEFKLEIFDKVRNEAVPLDETGIECTSLMPDTPGFMRVLALNRQAPGAEQGVCSLLPLTFDTPGKWIVIYSISLKGVKNFRADFPITVGGTALP